MSGEEIQKKIIEYLETCDWPSTTEDVAAGAGVSWNTAQVHLLKLVNEGRVKYKKVGRQNQFWLVRKYDKEIRVRTGRV
jgi:predicted ArsR family transcriptional regulator